MHIQYQKVNKEQSYSPIPAPYVNLLRQCFSEANTYALHKNSVKSSSRAMSPLKVIFTDRCVTKGAGNFKCLEA